MEHTPPRLALYREPHLIIPVRDFSEDEGRFVYRCEHDGIGLRMVADLLIHDADEVKGLKLAEQGSLAW